MREYAAPEVAEAWRKDVPVWFDLISAWNKPGSERRGFASYIADDAERAVQRGYAIAEALAREQAPIAAAQIAGRQEATALIAPHREAVTHMIEAPPPGETTLSIEAVPGEPDTFA